MWFLLIDDIYFLPQSFHEFFSFCDLWTKIYFLSAIVKISSSFHNRLAIYLFFFLRSFNEIWICASFISFLDRLTKIAFCSIICPNLQCFLVILLTKFTFSLWPICKIQLQLLAVKIPDSPLQSIGKFWDYFFVTNWRIDFAKNIYNSQSNRMFVK